MNANDPSEGFIRAFSIGIRTLYETVDHMEAMRKAIERMEMYILLLMILFYILFCGLFLGLAGRGAWSVSRWFRRQRRNRTSTGKHEQL